MKILSSNSKTGSNVTGCSVPRKRCCPGMSALCAFLCYVKRYARRFAATKKRPRNTLGRFLRNPKKFYNDLKKEINESSSKYIRIHVEGDFFSRSYISLWERIIKACPDKLFYSYTRAWNTKFRGPVLKLSRLPNVKIWASCDSSMPRPINVGLPTAYLMKDDQDVPPYKVDMVFRNSRRTVLKRVSGSRVCPHEDGTNSGITCSTCKLCLPEIQ